MGADGKVAKLKDRAQAAVNKEAFKKALGFYLELEKLEPKSGDWSRRVGEMQRRLNQPGEAVIAWTRAVEKFADAGFLLKAVAVCRMILRIDPGHMAARERLLGLNDERGIRPAEEASDADAAPPARAPAPPPPPAPAATDRAAAPLPSADRSAEAVSPTEELSLGDIALRDAVPGALELPSPIDLPELDDRAEKSGVFEIPLIELDDSDIEELADDDSEDRVRNLRQTPLFSELSVAALDRLIGEVELIELDADEELFHQGADGDCLYVISEGSVAVIDEGPPRQERAVLDEGSFFGEVAILMTQPRSATVVAREPTVLLSIGSAAMAGLIAEFPGVLHVLLRFLKSRLLENLMATSPLFAEFNEGERADLAKRFRVLEIEPGTVLIAAGSVAPGFYVLMAGVAESVIDSGDSPSRLTELRAGDVAGERSLLSGAPAEATVRAITKLIALELPADQFRELIMTDPRMLMYVSGLTD